MWRTTDHGTCCTCTPSSPSLPVTAHSQLRSHQWRKRTSQKTYIIFLQTVCSIPRVLPHLLQSPRQREVPVLYQVGTSLVSFVAVKLLLGSSSLLYTQHSSRLHFAVLEVGSTLCHPQSPPLLSSSHLSYPPY